MSARLPEQTNPRCRAGAGTPSSSQRFLVAAELAEIMTTGVRGKVISNGWRVTLMSEIFEAGRIQNKAIAGRGVPGANGQEVGAQKQEPSTTVALSGIAIDNM